LADAEALKTGEPFDSQIATFKKWHQEAKTPLGVA
jgi:hypothetical protein